MTRTYRLCRLNARYYGSSDSRFTRPDPFGQEKNPYLYAEGDPVTRINTEGTFSLSPPPRHRERGGRGWSHRRGDSLRTLARRSSAVHPPSQRQVERSSRLAHRTSFSEAF